LLSFTGFSIIPIKEPYRSKLSAGNEINPEMVAKVPIHKRILRMIKAKRIRV